MSQLLSGGLLLRKNLGTSEDPNNQSIGWAAPGVGDDPAGNGVAVEVWSHAIKDGKKTAVLPYFHWVFPFVKMRQSGDRVIENGMLATTFEGYGLGNANLQSGIDGRWEFPVAAERPYSYARADWAPTGLNGFYTWTDNSTDQVIFTSATAPASSRSTITLDSAAATLTNTLATLTFSAAHNIAASDEIYVQNVGALFNGTYTVASVTSNTVSYTNSSITADVSSFNVGASARVTVANSVTESHPAPVAVTSLGVTSPDSSFNVPGNVNYNEDNDIDFIIQSNENAATS